MTTLNKSDLQKFAEQSGLQVDGRSEFAYTDRLEQFSKFVRLDLELEINDLKDQLAASQAYAEQLREALETLNKVSNIGCDRVYEALALPRPTSALDSNQSRGVSDVIVERQRQINIEGWSSDHDDQHSYGEMALAAGCYVMFGRCFNADNPPKYWPWDKKWWKPTDKRRNLVKAAALIIAEIERIDRAAIASVKEKQNAAD